MKAKMEFEIIMQKTKLEDHFDKVWSKATISYCKKNSNTKASQGHGCGM